ncbi:hypothetical protein AGMMS50268_00880 [Spirochaetia bacterium]|nr:hypothetical protein AGMMS50268_00880 [Spirochaetia bacterium]
MKKVIAVFVVMATVTGAVFAQNRFALVIGNAAYTHIDSLSNTVNDARDIAASLGKLGFSVDLKLDVTEKEFGDAVDNYVAKLAANLDNEGFFWYAGHGIQVQDQNYLLPVDVAIDTERTLRRSAYSLNDLLDEFSRANNKVNVVVLDACRNNPLPAAARGSGTRGLAVIRDVPGDIFVMFSTAPGDVAEDGKGARNSPFATAFLKNIASTEPVVMVAVDVTNETLTLTGQKQRPFIRGSIISDKYYSLNPTAGRVIVTPNRDENMKDGEVVVPAKRTAPVTNEDDFDTIRKKADALWADLEKNL